MRQDKFSKAHLILYACGIIPVVWLALLLAPYLSSGLVDLVRNGGVALEHPFHIIWLSLIHILYASDTIQIQK